MMLPLTVLNVPNRNGRTYTPEHFKNLAKETFVLIKNDYSHVAIDLRNIVAKVTDVRIVKTADGDVLMGEVTPVWNESVGSKHVIETYMGFLFTGQAYLAQAGTVYTDKNGEPNMASYEFSHWIFSTDLE